MELNLLPEENLPLLSYGELSSWYFVDAAQMDAICAELERLM